LDQRASEAVFAQRNLTSNGLTYLVHTTSTGEFRLTLDSAETKESSHWAIAESKRKSDFAYWLTFGLSPNFSTQQ